MQRPQTLHGAKAMQSLIDILPVLNGIFMILNAFCNRSVRLPVPAAKRCRLRVPEIPLLSADSRGSFRTLFFPCLSQIKRLFARTLRRPFPQNAASQKSRPLPIVPAFIHTLPPAPCAPAAHLRAGPGAARSGWRAAARRRLYKYARPARRHGHSDWQSRRSSAPGS